MKGRHIWFFIKIALNMRQNDFCFHSIILHPLLKIFISFHHFCTHYKKGNPLPRIIFRYISFKPLVLITLLITIIMMLFRSLFLFFLFLFCFINNNKKKLPLVTKRERRWWRRRRKTTFFTPRHFPLTFSFQIIIVCLLICSPRKHTS